MLVRRKKNIRRTTAGSRCRNRSVGQVVWMLGTRDAQSPNRREILVD